MYLAIWRTSSGEEPADLGAVKLDGLSAEQILDLDLLCLRDQLVALAEQQLAEVGDDLDLAFGRGAVVEDTALFLLLAGGDSYDYVGYPELLAQHGDLGGGACDLDAQEPRVELGGVVVNKTDRLDVGGGIVRVVSGVVDLREYHPRRVSGSDDHRALLVVGLFYLGQRKEGFLEGEAEEQDSRGGDQIIQQLKSDARTLYGHQVQDEKARDEARGYAQKAEQVILPVKVAPQPRVRAEAEQGEDARDQMDGYGVKQHRRRMRLIEKLADPVEKLQNIVEHYSADNDDQYVRKHKHQLAITKPYHKYLPLKNKSLCLIQPKTLLAASTLSLASRQ